MNGTPVLSERPTGSVGRVGTAYYDLARNPPTYNFQDFLLAAEGWRIEQGLDRLSVRVLPGPAEGFRQDSLPPFGGAERRRWLENIVLPMPMLLPSCAAAAVLVDVTDRPDGPEFGRGRYLVGPTHAGAAARAGLYPFRAMPPMTETYWRRYGDNYVTITLRDPGWWPDRTSNLAEWRAVGEVLARRGYTVVFLPDGTKPDQAIEGFHTAPEASRHVCFRAALYAGAVMNFGISSGPMFLAWFMGVPMMMFAKLWQDEPCSGAGPFHQMGIEPGGQLPNARPRQRFVWQPQEAGCILAAFDRVMSGEAEAA